VQLESDEIVVKAAGAPEAPEIVLAGGEKGVPAGDPAAVVEVSDPAALAAPERAHRAAAHEPAARRLRLMQHRLVKHTPRDADRRKRQGTGAPRAGAVELDGVDRDRPQRGRLDAETAQIVDGLKAHELATDLVAGRGLAFDDDGLAPGAREVGRDGAAGDAAPDHERVGERGHPGHHTALNNMVSAVSPGPNAIAQPRAPAAGFCRIIASSTNSTVGDDMLP
jgi:hypothetical protein